MHALFALNVELEKAKKCAEEQDLEEAFRTYLTLLSKVERPNVFLPPTDTEKNLFSEALPLYFEHKYQEIIERFAHHLLNHPSFNHVRFIIATAYANLGQIPQFFEQFLIAFKNDPEHYLAHKTQSILAIRLWERIGLGEERDQLQENIIYHLLKAQEKEPKDWTLYKMLFRFIPLEKRGSFAETAVKQLLDHSITVPKGDIALFVDALVAGNHMAIAKQLVKNAKLWYPNSRMIHTIYQKIIGQE